MRAWKEHGLRHLGATAAELIVEHIARPSVDAVTAVPPDRVRQLERSRHPAEGLAVELGRAWGLASSPMLDRSRSAPRQAATAFAGRRANVAGAFVARGPISGSVLLVDDIYTTGSTASAAASALRAAGASRVVVVTFARAVR